MMAVRFMKPLFTIVLFWLASSALFAAEVIEVEVHGMTCAFCNANLQESLEKLPEISTVEVSYKQKKVRVVVDADDVDVSRITQAIVDAGFTPGQVQRNVPVR